MPTAITRYKQLLLLPQSVKECLCKYANGLSGRQDNRVEIYLSRAELRMLFYS